MPTGSEAGPGTVYVKFATVTGGADAEDRSHALLDTCERYAAERGLERLVAGVSTSQREVSATLLARGHRVLTYGVPCTDRVRQPTIAPESGRSTIAAYRASGPASGFPV